MKKKQQKQKSSVEVHHERPNVKKQLFISFLIIAFIALGTIGVILYAKGYRFLVQKGEPQLTKTGILNISSNPIGAQIYINDHPNPTTATNNSINLTPGKYTIKVSKDGYVDWTKDFEIKKEEVATADVTLFPKAPSLQSISTFGIESVLVDPSGTKLAFTIASQSAKRNGIYVVDMTTRSFPVLVGQSSATQIADDTGEIPFSEAKIAWSPDGKQILATVGAETDNPSYYLLDADRLNDSIQDVTLTIPTLKETWAEQKIAKDAALLKSLKPPIQAFLKKYGHVIAWSPDETKILYQASSSAQMPIFITPRRIGNNNLYERRDLEKDAIYTYDITEDINTRVVEPINTLCDKNAQGCEIPFTWFPDSDHLVYIHDKKIDVIEDDGSNITTMYAGPFIDYYVYPWPDGSKLVILTNLGNTSVSPTLYTIGLK